LRKGQINVAGKSLVPLYLISEPLSYIGCEWKRTAESIANSKIVTQTPSVPSSSIKETKVSSKPKGLREFLSQFGANLTNTPLFPEREEFTADTQEKKSSAPSSTPSKTNLFFQKLKQPAAESIVKSLTTFVNSFMSQPIDSMADQSQRIFNYLLTMETTIIEHSLWKDVPEDEIDAVSEGLEKYIMTRVYSNIFTQHCLDPEDENLSKRIVKLSFITPQHLDIKQQFINEASMVLACNELKKLMIIKHHVIK